ncbi:MAG: UDP-N-acetylmuramate dehydrogenase [Spirochaetota bacterium]|jgi:UDP-N-acetylmuramate dehydrogenase|nr:UDP-N-acetylmuramate dehydrogenase [Spirochaetota bacterium]
MEIQESVPLAPYTTFRIGGNARWYCAPQTSHEICAALAWARERALPWFALGRGSNLLVADAGYPGLIIHTLGMHSIAWEGAACAALPEQACVVRCGAGCATAVLADEAAGRGLSGLEFAGGLPGSIGGASCMNARAYGSEIADIFIEAEVVTPGGEIMRRTRADMRYAYKHSALMESGEIACSVTLALLCARDEAEREMIRARTEENRTKRVTMGQFRRPSAGCVFKNDYALGIPSGKLIDDAGLKGMRAGCAEVSSEHANFIVNHGDARAADVRELIARIKDIINEKYGVMLEEEITYLGFDSAAPRQDAPHRG